jgi:hypothetical protein
VTPEEGVLRACAEEEAEGRPVPEVVREAMLSLARAGRPYRVMALLTGERERVPGEDDE